MRFAHIASLALFALPGCSSAPVSLVDYENQPVRRISSQSISMNEVQIDVRMAVSRKGWSVSAGDVPGRLTATRHDGDASATIEVYYNLNSYSIRYKQSSGLGFANNCTSKAADGQANSGTRCIRPTYNEWVQELNTELSGKLQY